MCGYYNSPPTNKTQRQVLWLRNSGKTSTKRISGPITDHTTGTIDGWYAFVPLDSQFDGVATLRSEIYNFRGKDNIVICISFWYHILSNTTNSKTPKLQISRESVDHKTIIIEANLTANANDGWQ